MKALVTGGAGYIGSVVSAHLVADGHEVVVLDDLSRGHAGAVPEGTELVEADLLDLDRVRAVVDRGFDAVLHFAARSLVGESVAQPSLYFRSNVVATLNLVDAIKRTGVPRMVFSSTAAVYGDPESVPITEDAPTRPTNPYGASKLAMDHLIGFEAVASGFGAVSLRYFNVAGAAYGVGELHDPETHLIPLALEAAQGSRNALELYGTDYPTRDGTAVRDYIHVADLATAHVLAMDAAEAGTHRIFNLGNGQGFSVREVIDTVRHVTGAEVPVIERGRRAGDPAVLVASSDKIRRELGWTPRKPELSAMVEDAWEWLRHGQARLHEGSPGTATR